MVLHTFVPVPAAILAVAAGMAPGPLWGFITTWVGSMLSAYLGFFLIHTFGQPLLLRLLAPNRLERVQDWRGQVDIPILSSVRLVSMFSFNLINLVLGLTQITGWRFRMSRRKSLQIERYRDKCVLIIDRVSGSMPA